MKGYCLNCKKNKNLKLLNIVKTAQEIKVKGICKSCKLSITRIFITISMLEDFDFS